MSFRNMKWSFRAQNTRLLPATCYNTLKQWCNVRIIEKNAKEDTDL